MKTIKNLEHVSNQYKIQKSINNIFMYTKKSILSNVIYIKTYIKRSRNNYDLFVFTRPDIKFLEDFISMEDYLITLLSIYIIKRV